MLTLPRAPLEKEPCLSEKRATQVCDFVQSNIDKIVSQSSQLSEISPPIQQAPNDDTLALKYKIGSGGSCDVWGIDSGNGFFGPKQQNKLAWKRLAAYKVESEKDEPRKISTAVRDIWLEALVLTALQEHPNIVTLRGCTNMELGMKRLTQTGHLDGFGLLLDRVDCTLSEQIPRWGEQQSQKRPKQCQSKLSQITAVIEPYASWHQRVQMARDLASALAYIHDKEFMHRDVKPANIGLCVDGSGRHRIQLLDFGLAVQCPKQNTSDDAKLPTTKYCHHFQSKVGTRRYMAPEVILRKPYTEKVDVFSFSICLWEIIAMERPFSHVPLGAINVHVSEYHGRPKLPFFATSCWTRPIRQLLKQAWHRDASRRPSMHEIGDELDTILKRSNPRPLARPTTKIFGKNRVRAHPLEA